MSKLTDFFASIFSKFASPELAEPVLVPVEVVAKTVDGVKPAVAAKKSRKPRAPKVPDAK